MPTWPQAKTGRMAQKQIAPTTTMIRTPIKTEIAPIANASSEGHSTARLQDEAVLGSLVGAAWVVIHHMNCGGWGWFLPRLDIRRNLALPGLLESNAKIRRKFL